MKSGLAPGRGEGNLNVICFEKNFKREFEFAAENIKLPVGLALAWSPLIVF